MGRCRVVNETVTVQDVISGNIGHTLYHATLRNRDGSALRARVNGQVRTWVTRPSEFRLPMKHGLKECFYITQENVGEWQHIDITQQG